MGNTKPDPTRRFPPGCQQASAEARRARAEARRRDLAPLVWKSIAEGKSHRIIANEFNETGVVPARQSKWTEACDMEDCQSNGWRVWVKAGSKGGESVSV